MQYDIHDNGGVPFQVVIFPDNIIINKVCDYKNNVYNKFMELPRYIKYFVGKDIRPHELKCSYKHEDGNSILVQIRENSYLYIGSEIYEMTIPDKIIDYISPIGNNDVPYPFAIGKKNTYLMLEEKFIDNSLVVDATDPYVYYYEMHEYVTGLHYIHLQLDNKYEGKPYDHIIDIDDEENEKEERKYFNIPVITHEDEEKYVAYRMKKYNVDQKYLIEYKKYKVFDTVLRCARTI